MGGRYTGGVEDYPEHLNPFREEGDGDDSRKSRLTALGRRKLRAVLNLTSWTLFPWRKSKGVEKASNGSGRNRFLTMTPKLSRHIIERLSKRKPRSASLAPASNPATSTGQRFSYTEFRIMPKSSREKFAVRPTTEKQENVLEGSYLWADRTSAPDLTLSSTSTSPVSEVCGDEDLHVREPRYTKQGAKPKKKRPAPPPPLSASGTPADKHVNTTAETEELPASPTPPSPASKNIDASFHESPPGSPTSNDSASLSETVTTSNTTCALVHEPSPTSNHTNAATQETSIASSNTCASTYETSRTSSNVSDSTHETSIMCKNINVSITETSLTSNNSISTHETSTTSDTISASNHETSTTSETISASNHEKSTTSNINALAHETLPACPTAKNLTVSVQETPETTPTSNDVSVSVHETKLETSSNLTPLDGDDHKEVTPTACKL